MGAAPGPAPIWSDDGRGQRGAHHPARQGSCPGRREIERDQVTRRRSNIDGPTHMTRNASGESSIYQDTAGRWHGKVSMGMKDGGVRDRRHVSGQRRADVVTKVRAREQA